MVRSLQKHGLTARLAARPSISGHTSYYSRTWRFRSWEAAGLPLPLREGPSAVARSSLYCSSPRPCQVVWLDHVEQQRRAVCSWLLPLGSRFASTGASASVSMHTTIINAHVAVHPSRGCTRRGDWVVVVVVLLLLWFFGPLSVFMVM